MEATTQRPTDPLEASVRPLRNFTTQPETSHEHS
jgi:hypothetical protein